MLLISAHPEYLQTGIIQPEDRYHEATGRYLDTTPGVDAAFQHGGVPEWAMEQALAYKPFKSLWNALPDGAEHRLYVSRYDTDKEAGRLGWDAETKDYVEQCLLKHPDFGVRYIIAQPAEATQDPPWPNYENTQWKQVVFVAKEIGVDLGYVLGWEQSHRARPGVIANLEAELASPEVPVEEEFVAA